MKEYKWLPKIYKWQQWRELISTEQTGTSFKYEIGEYVPSEGGVIYHRFLTGTTQNYLVVDTEDVGQDAWSDPFNTTSGATSLWNGFVNTTSIISVSGAGAAVTVWNHVSNGKTDWYLPAIQELNKLWSNMLEVSQGIEAAGGSQLAFDTYWSSTEFDSNNAWTFYFLSGGANYLNAKNFPYYVRAVRKFSI